MKTTTFVITTNCSQKLVLQNTDKCCQGSEFVVAGHFSVNTGHLFS